MIDQALIEKTEQFVKDFLGDDPTGHDWWHIDRVVRMALHLAKAESADKDIVHMSALLHDVADHKLNDGDEEKGKQRVRDFLLNDGVTLEVCERLLTIINEVSFRGAGVETPTTSIESKCVQDADRLDAIGAIGIARAFMFGGAHQRPMYDPEIPPKEHTSFEEYKKRDGTTINHFYEKLLLLKDRMQTDEGRRIAQQRHIVIESFVRQLREDCGLT